MALSISQLLVPGKDQRRNRILAAAAPLATSLVGLVALVMRKDEYYLVIGEAYVIEMFVTMPFMLIVIAAAATHGSKLRRITSWMIRSIAVALYLLCAAFPVYKMFGWVGFLSFWWLTFATYSGILIHRRFEELARVILPILAWWAVAIVFVVIVLGLNAVGLKVGEKIEDYYFWPAGTLACAVSYFALLAWFELSGVYEAKRLSS